MVYIKIKIRYVYAYLLFDLTNKIKASKDENESKILWQLYFKNAEIDEVEKKESITLKFIAIAANAENRFADRKNLTDFLQISSVKFEAITGIKNKKSNALFKTY